MKPTTLLLPILLLAGCGAGDVIGPRAGRRRTRQDVYRRYRRVKGYRMGPNRDAQ